jgi:hypothetical protein
LIVKAEQTADANNTNINFFILFPSGKTPRVFELTMLNVFRPRQATVYAIAAEPAEKPDARLLGVRP